MKLAKKLIIPSAMILAISPVAIIASCTSTAVQDDQSVLKKLVEDLNNNQPVWNDDYGKPTPDQSEVVAKIAKNDLDQMSVANQHHLLLNEFLNLIKVKLVLKMKSLKQLLLIIKL